jgi:hypothetical protein
MTAIAAVLIHAIDYNFLMKYFSCFLLFLVLTVVSAVPLSADELTLFGGFNHPGKVTLGDTTTVVSGTAGQLLTDAKDFGVFGFRLFKSTTAVGLEHTLAFSPNFLDSRANALIYNTNVLIQPPAVPIQPYATAGVGVVRAGGSGPAAFGTKFSVNYGAGIKSSLFGPWGVRLDVRGYTVRGVEDQYLNVWESSVGLFFGF